VAKLSKLQLAAIAMMPEIVAATTAEGGYVFKDPFNVAYLLEEGLIEQNGEITNPECVEEVATRATEKGFNFVNGVNAATLGDNPTNERNTNVMSETATGFVIENVALPASKRGGRIGKAKYPFDLLEVGQSFVVPATEKNPDPAKTLASTVSSAMKKYDVPDMLEDGVTQKTKIIAVPKTKEKRTVLATKHTRVFGLRPEVDAAGTVIGARIGRTA